MTQSFHIVASSSIDETPPDLIALKERIKAAATENQGMDVKLPLWAHYLDSAALSRQEQLTVFYNDIY